MLALIFDIHYAGRKVLVIRISTIIFCIVEICLELKIEI